ncbi:MAG TPA: MFS transporter, partial [Acidimicrobiales bacterium]|nr:MFS transporter [Acidimicrobiales bacterium]
AVERAGTKLVVVVGLVVAAIGLLLMTRLTAHSGYVIPVLAAILVAGLGMGLTLSPSTEAIMGSLPRQEAGVGSAMNGTNIQVGGALGVAVLGSVLNGRYRSWLSPTMALLHLPKAAAHIARSSLGGGLSIASHLPAAAASQLAASAKASFVAGVNLADLLAMSVVLTGALVALAFLPARARMPAERTSHADAHPEL